MHIKTFPFVSARFFLALIVLMFGTSGTSRAQNQNGSISGTVVDSQQKAVPNASITATEITTKSTNTATTDDQGHFVFPEMVPGMYVIAVEAAGFKKYSQENVVLHVNEKLVLTSLALEVGAVTETVTVTEQQVQLKTESAEISDTLENKQMENLAVNGRSPLSFVALTPGVSSQVNVETAGTGGISSFAANGVRNNSNQITINGIGDIDTGLNGVQNVTVSLDSVQEFTILTGIYQAQYGRSSGAQINLVTKSGTQKFPGSGYIYHRNEGMNANDFIDSEQGFPKPLFRYNDPGYTIGGPIYLPAHFNTKKDKLFFFWSQEFQRQLIPQATRDNVWIPTAAEATGDFSADASPYIKDPLSSQPCAAPSGSTQAQTGGCFDGLKNGVATLGVIPTNRLYTAGLTYLSLLSHLDPNALPVNENGGEL